MANFKTQQIDIQSSSATSIDVLPVPGHILPFIGPSNKIPTGWVLCDGTNGTPDLRGKFPGGDSGISVGGTESHTHTFTPNLSAFSAGNVVDTATIANQSTGANNVAHNHISNAAYALNAFGNTGPANRATGTQANVIGMNHTHSTVAQGNVTSQNTAAGNQSADHSHTFLSSSVNANTSTSHSHSISGTPVMSNPNVTSTSLPAIFYVNFIMKV